MNQDTGHLVNTSDMSEKELNRISNRNYKEISEDLNKQAFQELGNKNEVIASKKLRAAVTNTTRTHNSSKRKKTRRKKA